ncbi:BRE1 E3 ubiquitin ligase-domain-containing protein [Abortiporus biennis]|nr:BRE1 E3 ubiquitin ligase-domain-containing protein [Abortiporus biennis]
MESKKRLRTEESDGHRLKKRALTDEHDTPRPVNGTSSEPDEPKDGDSLEMFRKDAIYRRMKHYSRENDRNLSKIAELERRRNTCEAGLAALEACWSQLLGTIRSLARPEDLPLLTITEADIYDLTTHVASDPDPVYVEGLRGKVNATQQLVEAFVQLGGKTHDVLARDEVYKRCQEAQTECSSLRSEVSFIRAKLKDAESEKEKLHDQLVTAEKRVDRLQSKTIAALQRHSSPQVKETVKDESPRDSPSSPSPLQPPVNGFHSLDADSSEWKDLAEFRAKKLEEYSQQNQALQSEVHALMLQVQAPPDEVVFETPQYKTLAQFTTKLEYHANHARQELNVVQTEVEQLQASRQEWQDELTATAEKTLQELRNMLAKRDNENSRLREQRDQQQSELNERKQKDSVKLASINEVKALSESRADRIKVLESEVTRLKTRLAAESSDEDLMSFLFRCSSDDVSYIEDLKHRLSAAEARSSALESSLSFFQEDHPDVVQHMRAETEAKQQLAEISRKLQQYESTFGSSSTLSPDLQSLSQQLKQKEAQIEQLRLKEKQRDQAKSSLYSELDKLSAAWEALENQVKSKVFDLTAMEDRLTKAGLDKAKSENKFYSAMRDKEAIENERKNLSRNLEKQTKVVERLYEAEKNLTSRTVYYEKEIVMWRQAVEALKNRIDVLEADMAEWKHRAETERQRAEDMRLSLVEQEKVFERKRADLRVLEEATLKTKKEAEKQAARSKALTQTHGAVGSRESELQAQVDKCMSLLQCSTCKERFRTTVITKCMHSFCKECVESRIQSRQRKCPACGLAFSAGEVQTLFFQ